MGTTSLSRGTYIESNITVGGVGGLMNAPVVENFSTPELISGHSGIATYTITTYSANVPSRVSSFDTFGVCGNAGSNPFLIGNGGRTICYTEIVVATVNLGGAEHGSGLPMAASTRSAGLYVTVGGSSSETANSYLIAEHRVDDEVAASTFLIDALSRSHETLELLNSNLTQQISAISSPMAASFTVASDALQIPAARAITDKFDEALADVRNTLSDAELAAAGHAIADARSTFASLPFVSTPLIWVNDEGVAAIQWEAWPSGVLLVFTGDGTFTASVRDGGRKRYINGAREYAVSGGIPPELSEAILAVR